MDNEIREMVVDIIKQYNDNSVKYTILEKRAADVRKVLDTIESERNMLHAELRGIRDKEQAMLAILSKTPDFDMEGFKLEIQEIAKNIGSE